MVPPLLFDISEIDLDQVQYGVQEIERINPHRGNMRLLDGITYLSESRPIEIIAFKDVRDDEFWVEGHIPGRPIFPGVLMIEAAAQLASFCSLKTLDAQFMGFTSCDDVKFRGQVVPGDRLVLISNEIKIHPRRCICNVQGLLQGRIIFEAKITGMVM